MPKVYESFMICDIFIYSLHTYCILQQVQCMHMYIFSLLTCMMFILMDIANKYGNLNCFANVKYVKQMN